MSLAFTSFAFDKAVYNPGDAITLTVVFTSDDVVPAASVASAVSVTLSDDASGSVTQTSDGSAAFPDFSVETVSDTAQPVNVSATDTRTPSGTWTVQSNSFAGTAAPFTGTAVLTSVA